MPVADSEIIFGAYTEYTGLRFAFFLLAEYAGIVLLSALTAVLFLGGWHALRGLPGLALDPAEDLRPRRLGHLAAPTPPARGPASAAGLAVAVPLALQLAVTGIVALA